jgi:hypothetical protein
LFDRLPFNDKTLEAHQVFADHVGVKEWAEIITILADLSNGPSSVALQTRASDLINKLAAEYADSWAYDYAASKL